MQPRKGITNLYKTTYFQRRLKRNTNATGEKVIWHNHQHILSVQQWCEVRKTTQNLMKRESMLRKLRTQEFSYSLIALQLYHGVPQQQSSCPEHPCREYERYVQVCTQMRKLRF